MKKILLLLFILPLFCFGQIPPGANFLIPADTGATLPRLATGYDIRGWTWSNDTLHSPYNVIFDSSALMNYNGNYLGWRDVEDLFTDPSTNIVSFYNGSEYQAKIGSGYNDTTANILFYYSIGGDPYIEMYADKPPKGSALTLSTEMIYMYADSVDLHGKSFDIEMSTGTKLLLWRDTIYGVNGTDTLRIFPTL